MSENCAWSVEEELDWAQDANALHLDHISLADVQYLIQMKFSMQDLR